MSNEQMTETQTPQQPRWTVRAEGRFWHVVDSPPARREYRLNSSAEATWLCKDLNHLEGALREAEKDIAFIHEQHDEEAVRVYTQIFDLNAKLREAEQERDEAVALKLQHIDGRIEQGKNDTLTIVILKHQLATAENSISDLQTKLREAEAKAAIAEPHEHVFSDFRFWAVDTREDDAGWCIHCGALRWYGKTHTLQQPKAGA